MFRSRHRVAAAFWALLLFGRPLPASAVPKASGTPTGTETRPTVRERIGTEYKVSRLKNGTIRFKHPGFTADVHLDGTVRMKNHTASWSWRTFGLAFDITESMMRAKGQDPYAGDKIRFLKATLEWRLALRRQWTERLRAAFLNDLPARLLRIWTHPALTAAHRRRLLFTLWDESLEPDGTRAGRLGQIARDIIVRFIRKNLPQGSPGAYTPREIAAYTRKRESRQPFRPYAVPAPPDSGARTHPVPRPVRAVRPPPADEMK